MEDCYTFAIAQMRIKQMQTEGNKKESVLTPLQGVLADLLIMLGVEENALVGTMLLLKDSEREMEEMLLYLWGNRPTPEEIDKKLVEIVLARRD